MCYSLLIKEWRTLVWLVGRKKIAVEQDYDALIASSEEKIANLTEELKLEKTNLKQLRKDWESWEAEKRD